jgi:hypothetical protein
MEDVGIFYGHLVYFTIMAIWYILPLWPSGIGILTLWPFGIFYPFWYFVPKNLATLEMRRAHVGTCSQ